MIDKLSLEAAFDAVAPDADRGAWPGLVAAMDRGELNDVLRDHRTAAEFLAQCSHETGGFRKLEESLWYRAARLRQTFPNYYDRLGMPNADDHAGKPEVIANHVYADTTRRSPLGNIYEGDGWTFRGGGATHTTGRENYTIAAREVGMEPAPYAKKLRTDWVFAFADAARYWRRRVLPEWDGTTDHATLLINGGLNGLAHRIMLVDGAYSAMVPQPLRHPAPAMALQRALVAAGGDVGTIDGIAGPATRAAVKKFQTMHGLRSDGDAGPITVAALNAANGFG